MTAVLLMVAAGAAGDAATQARKDFDDLFGSQVRAAKKASRPDDDLKLAGQILDAARGASVSAELMTLLCDAVCDLAGSTPAGQELAVQAAELLTNASPDKASHAQRKLLEVGLRVYNAAAGPAKTQAGQDCIEKLLALSQAPGAEPGQVLADLKAAEGIASPIGADSARSIRAKIQMIEMTAAATKKAERTA